MSQGMNRNNGGHRGQNFDPSGEDYRNRYGDRYNGSYQADSSAGTPRRRSSGWHPQLSRPVGGGTPYNTVRNMPYNSAYTSRPDFPRQQPDRRGHANTAASRSAGVDAYSSRQRQRQADNRGQARRPASGRGRADARADARTGARDGAGNGRLPLNLPTVRFEPPTFSTLVGILVVAAIVGGGFFWWTNRSITIKLNGSNTSVKVGSSIAAIVKEKHVSTTAGDLISVGGNVLSEGEGYAYSATLNGEEMASDKVGDYRASDGDDLTIGDGADKYEDYDVNVVEEQPKLEMGGDAWGNITYISQWPRVGKREVRHGKVSGETADGDWIQETQNCVVTVHQISPDDSSQKLIALSFDDGPAETYTEKYIEILNQYGIHATFFNLGQNIEQYPDLAKKIVESGNELMSHTYQHQQLTTLESAALQSEFSSAFSLIESTTGVKTSSFRPPYGDFKESTWLKSGGLASLSVLWNLDSEDWRRAGADSIVSKSTTGAFSGAIILMHDGGGDRSQDVEALPRIIETLQAEGYKFVTVGELMKSDSSIPEDIANGYATMPDDCTWPTEIAQ